MKPLIPSLLCAAVAVLPGCSGTAPKDELLQKVDELYDRMTMPERLAQLQSCFMDDLFGPDNQLDTAKCAKYIPNGIGHFSQFCMQAPRDPNVIRDRVAKIQAWLRDNTPNGIPALCHEEVLSGINTLGATVYPQQIGQACSFNPELAELKTRQTGIEMRQMGGVLSLSPMVDVCRNPSFNRLEESYGEDAYLSAVLGTAFVRGLQQGDLRRGVGACSKHYLGYGGGGDADEKEMMEEILLPHETMIRLADSHVVMPGYHAVHGTNCVANSEILTDILRGYVGFDGMIVSDYTAIDQIPDPHYGSVERAAVALNAGNDVDFPTGSNYGLLPMALAQQQITMETFERAVKNVLRHKFRQGLFDADAYLYSNDTIVLDPAADRQTAYDIASQSVVLLQNNGVLPLREPRKVLLTGPNANTMWAMCGDYSYPAMSYFWKMVDATSENPHIVTLREGLANKQPEGFQLDYERGCDWTEELETAYTRSGDERAWDYDLLHRMVDSGEKTDAKAALAKARQADVIICAVGENVMLCGENRDRKEMRVDLPGRQEQYVEELLATGKPVVLVIFGGRAQVISKIADRCAAIIQAWYPGEEGGNALADILYGNIAPSGKLSVSYPNQPVNAPLCYNYSAAQDPRVAWPFGFGLSYTTFEYANIKADAEVSTKTESLSLSFEVRNTGAVAADEVAQIYLSPTDASQPIRPIQLQGFARVSLQPGESRTVSVRLYTEQLGYYTHEGDVRQWNIAPGKYILKVGASSQDIRLQQEVTLTGKLVNKPLRDQYFSVAEVR